MTTVLVAAHGGDTIGLSVMQDIARKTKGRFYNVTNNKALPRIFQKEARLISRPLIYERPQPWAPQIATYSEPIVGLPDDLPGITGIVQASVKENELVEVPLVSPLPANTGQINPLLAHWTYGLGRSVAFTSDAGRKWANSWPEWDSYAAFWSQVVRWSLRPVDKGNLTMSVRREEGKIKVVVDALDKDNEFLNFLQFRGVVIRPDLKRQSVELSQVAPGRYEGEIERAEERGNYFINLGYRNTDGTTGVMRSGVSVPYSDEYRELKSNPATLETIASLTNGKRDGLEVRPREPRARPSAHPGRGGRLPPRQVPDPSQELHRPLVRPALAGRRPVPGRCRRAADRAGHRPDAQDRRRHLAEAPRPRGRPADRLHGEAQGPQGRGRRADRAHPLGHPVRGPPLAHAVAAGR